MDNPSHDHNNIRIFQWNCRSSSQRRAHLQLPSWNFVVLLLCETCSIPTITLLSVDSLSFADRPDSVCYSYYTLTKLFIFWNTIKRFPCRNPASAPANITNIQKLDKGNTGKFLHKIFERMIHRRLTW